jgi:hypothetical protein
MNAQRKIEKALQDNNMKVGRIWKGYSPFTTQTGWHRSNGQDWFLGSNVNAAIDTIEALAEARSM